MQHNKTLLELKNLSKDADRLWAKYKSAYEETLSIVSDFKKDIQERIERTQANIRRGKRLKF